MSAADLQKELKTFASKDYAKTLQWFFKTGPGQYGEGDEFIGVRMPYIRRVSKQFSDLSFIEIKKLLASPIHEERMAALVILTLQFSKAKYEKTKKTIFDFYLDQKSAINNWDLVDVSVHKVIGAYLLDKPRGRKLLYTLAKSENLWDRRLAMVATAAFIRAGDLDDVFKLATLLEGDRHDLMHKAVGWMLREAGKKDLGRLEDWLQKNDRYKTIPRTMLRYSIERFPEAKRKAYLKGAAT